MFGQKLTILAICYLALTGGSAHAASIPRDLMWPTTAGYRSGYLHGDRWDHAYRKLHTGIDIVKPAGVPVVAVEAGIVRIVFYDSQWGYCAVIEHSDAQGSRYTSTYWHINPFRSGTVRWVSNGQRVGRGQQVGTVYNLGNNSHLHFGLRNAPYSYVAQRGALPQDSGQADPRWPEYNIDPIEHFTFWRGLPDGRMYKGSRDEVYVAARGGALWVRELSDVNFWGGWGAITTVSDPLLGWPGSGRLPVSGSLVKERDSDAIWLVRNGQKCYVRDMTQVARFGGVFHTVPIRSLEFFGRGPDVRSW